MPIFTTADRDAVKAALITAAVDGFASVSVGGQTVASKSLDELQRLLAVIQADLARANPSRGLSFVQLVPGGTG